MRTPRRPGPDGTPTRAGDAPSDPAALSKDDPRWLDRLVELHVLAEHGDAASAEVAEQWLACDGHARQVWESVEYLRDQLLAGPPKGAAALGFDPDETLARAAYTRAVYMGPVAAELVRRRLDEQLDEHEDMVLDLKEMGERHGEALDSIAATLARHAELLEQQNALLTDVLHRLTAAGSGSDERTLGGR